MLDLARTLFLSVYQKQALILPESVTCSLWFEILKMHLKVAFTFGRTTKRNILVISPQGERPI